jgi:cytosine/adenosine deaminase-related metal-dependent hydrolase
MSKDVIVRNGTIISMDPGIGVLFNADVLVGGDKLISVGPNLEAPAGAEEIDASNCIVMPGFIDTHRHIWQGAMRSVCADWSLLDYIRGIRMNAASAFLPDDMYAAQYHGALEAMDSGVTTVADYCHNINTQDHAHEAIRGLQDAGLRAVWCYGFNTPPIEEPAFKSRDERVSFARDLAERYFLDDASLLTLGLSPEEVLFWGEGNSQGIKQFELAKELNARIFWHCNSASIEGRPREVATLEKMGLLNSNMTLVHMHATDPDEWAMVANAGAGVSFTPDTELQMGMQWPMTEVARAYGIPQSYGIDITSNNSADFYVCLRMALQQARCRENIRANGEQLALGVPFSCAEALAWGTIDAARAIGMEDRIGSLTPGKQADLQLLRMDDLTTIGWDKSNPEGSVIMQGQARNVDTVMVSGRLVKHRGRMLADVGHACSLLSEANERVTREVNTRGGYLLPLEDAFGKIELISRN